MVFARRKPIIVVVVVVVVVVIIIIYVICTACTLCERRVFRTIKLDVDKTKRTRV